DPQQKGREKRLRRQLRLLRRLRQVRYGKSRPEGKRSGRRFPFRLMSRRQPAFSGHGILPGVKCPTEKRPDRSDPGAFFDP
ncbi:MAG: hypothetical protein IIU18_08620, partial [Oscillospiraceae bacterium]|nr:hypothetical protein [Oscillospiraceae bacterium]